MVCGVDPGAVLLGVPFGDVAPGVVLVPGVAGEVEPGAVVFGVPFGDVDPGVVAPGVAPGAVDPGAVVFGVVPGAPFAGAPLGEVEPGAVAFGAVPFGDVEPGVVCVEPWGGVAVPAGAVVLGAELCPELPVPLAGAVPPDPVLCAANHAPQDRTTESNVNLLMTFIIPSR